MADTQFAIIFQGQVTDGADPAKVRENLARLFKADPARIEKMFSGQKVVIKKGLDSVAAGKYKVALGKAGALVEAVAMQPAPAAPAAPAPDAGSATGAAPAAARTPAPAAPQTVPAGFTGDSPPAALETSLADPGETLVEYEVQPAPDIATDHLTVAEVGVTLVEAEAVPEPDYDLSAMTLDPPGTTLVEAEPVPEPEFDLSGMSLDENP